MRIAILGGSFNPVHIGHLVLAEEVRVKCGYDKIFFVPANLPPHKQLACGATNEERLQMLNLAISSNPFFAVDTCELERGGVSYTFVTLQDFYRRYGSQIEGKIGFIMGDDLIEGFEGWYQYQKILEIADIILARRKISGDEKVLKLNYPHIELANSIFPLSSSEVREKIAGFGKLGGWRYLVPDAVYHYIEQRNLYGKADRTC